MIDPKGRYMEGEVNIHYRSPIRREEKEFVPEDELRKRQEDQVNLNVIYGPRYFVKLLQITNGCFQN